MRDVLSVEEVVFNGRNREKPRGERGRTMEVQWVSCETSAATSGSARLGASETGQSLSHQPPIWSVEV